MNEVPWYVVFLVLALLVAWAGMLTCFAETKAVGTMRRWPFHTGVVAVRLYAAPCVSLGSVRTAVTDGAVYSVVSSSECFFVAQGWRSVLSWTRSASPFRLKGKATCGPRGVEVVGRISLGACITIPAMAVWLAGCGLIGVGRSPAFSLFVLAGALPLAGTWFSLPREIAAFRATWLSIQRELGPGAAV